MSPGQAALLRRDRGQAGEANHVAGGVNMRLRGLKMFVDAQPAAVIRLQASGGEVQFVRRSLAADSIEQGIPGDSLVADQVGDQSSGSFFDALTLFTEGHGAAVVARVI